MVILKKTVTAVFAFLLNGMGVSFFILAGFGLDTISVFSTGLANVFHTTVGMASLGFYFTVILAAFFYNRRYINVATVLSLVIVGPSIDLFTNLFSQILTPESGLVIRVVFFIAACLILAFAVALYLSLHLGISAADIIPVAVSDRFRRQFRWCKVAFDITIVILGILMGGNFGIGTVITAFTIGPMIQFIRQKLEKRNHQ